MNVKVDPRATPPQPHGTAPAQPPQPAAQPHAPQPQQQPAPAPNVEPLKPAHATQSPLLRKNWRRCALPSSGGACW